ncbi:hypothetical protein BHF71_06775 [Vulcanibacillus modesticaldus]|uniref:Integrase n=1 Tax=Vulcanibacillus modesticaldus TaxID=337097 RepID=A0A1D2YWD9_9BACI|nr:tyrosine-type recombinase/integrase [Vulcanibacillus modesticaldus]OEG00055.1 hypothetical protein BHF71_06775 [Vulcanibacillus modesticaldus]
MKGHVRKRGNKWVFVLDVGIKPDGSRDRKWFSGYNTKKEAEKAMAEKIAEINRGEYVAPIKTKFKDYMTEWLDSKQVKKRTLETYTWLVEKHIIPTLGNIELQKLNAMHIDKLLNKLRKEKALSDGNIQKIYTLINDALNKAVKYGLLQKNVASYVDKPKASKPEIKVWDQKEVNKFLKIAKQDRSYIVFLLALATGMRQSEILGLQWDNVDFENGLIYVKQQIERGTHNFTSLKTKAAYRNISIDEDTIAALRRHKVLITEEKLKAGPAYTDMNLVAPTSLGTPYLHSNITKIFNRLIKEAGVEKIKFHGLRHTHATLLLLAGVNPKTVAERLSHADFRITLDIYSHLLPNIQKDTAIKIGKILYG